MGPVPRVVQNRRRLTPFPRGTREARMLDGAARRVALAGGRDGDGFDEVSGREAKLFFGRKTVTPKSRPLLPGPKAIRGAAVPLGRKEPFPSRTEGIPSSAEGNPSQSEGNPSRAEGNPNVYSSVKSRSFNGLRPTPAGGLGVTRNFFAPSWTKKTKSIW
jgi:hypothetical protein